LDTTIKHALYARIALFSAAIIWGSSFFVMKNTVDILPPFYLMAIRFTVGCILLAVIFHKRLKALNKEYFRQGAVIGALLACAYAFQTIGLTDTTPGKNAFLTAVYCVIVPFLYWAVDRTRPDRYNAAAALLCIIGIGLVSLSGGFSISFGDAFTLISGVFYACHIVAVAKLGRGKDMIVITVLQFGYAAVFNWIAALCTETWPAVMPAANIWQLVYLSVFATTLALLLQNVGLKWENPSAASIILSLESVFGVLFSILFYGESLTLRLFFGFAVIFVAILISETKLSFIKRPKLP
jgi:drug/metabolite transporter (DMT)-like permease